MTCQPDDFEALLRQHTEAVPENVVGIRPPGEVSVTANADSPAALRWAAARTEQPVTPGGAAVACSRGPWELGQVVRYSDNGMATIDDASDLRFGSQHLTEAAERVALRQSERLIRLSRTQLTGRADELRPVYYSIAGTCIAISVLCRGGFLNEATMVVRALLERVVNAAFALHCSAEDYRRYLEHTPTAGYGAWDQLASKPPEEVHAYPDLDDALRYFSKESGRWTGLSLRQRIKASSLGQPREATLFLSAALMLYGEGSEALHGSFYGCTMCMGAFKDTDGRKVAIDAVYHRKHSFIFLTVAHLIAALIRGIGLQADIEFMAEEVNRDEAEVERLLRASVGGTDPSQPAAGEELGRDT